MYELNVLVNGFPGKSSTHGGLGWSSVCLLRDATTTVLVDTGPPAYISLLHRGLESLGVRPAEVTDILATHLHWDHIGNFTMFPEAKVTVARNELEWASRQPPGTDLIPDLHVRRLAETVENVRLIEDREEVLPGIRAIATPGHTPGHICYRTSTRDGDVLFAGDAVKNRYELATGDVDSSMDRAMSRESVESLRSLMRDDPSVVMVPGHDVRLSFVGGELRARERQLAELSVFLDTDAGASPRRIT